MTAFKSIQSLLMISLCAIIIATAPLAAKAQGLRGLSIIRDVEIEETLKEWANPLLKAANLNPKNVNIILVQSNQVNAFVAGGANIFLYTGLLEASDTPDEIIGVLAHEIGHIAGGHLAHNTNALRKASYESILGTVLGVGAAIIAGDGRIGMAVASASQQFATQNYLSHSRTNEASADQAALTFLERSKLSAKGFLSFFKKLENQELKPAHKQDPYARTHPITGHRIASIRKSVESSPYHDAKTSPKWEEQHKRMKAKLISFITPNHVPWHYNDRDQSFAARYARTISAYRLSRTSQALKAVDDLLQEEPNNPYLHELKAQMLTEFGRVNEAIPSLQKTIKISPNEPLFHITLGHALLETAHDNPQTLQKAIKHLNIALKDEKRSPHLRRLLARAYGQAGQTTKAELQLAEEALLQRKTSIARRRAAKVIEQSAKDSPEAIQAADILQLLKVVKK